MTTAIIIPARLESTRLPNKALLARTGTPLVCHTAMRAAKIRDLAPDVFSHVIVAVDHEAVLTAVNGANLPGVAAVMTDPRHQSGSDRIAEAAKGLPKTVTRILNLQGDEPDLPERYAVDLAAFHAGTGAGAGADISTLVYPVESAADRANPALVKAVLGVGGRALYFSRAEIPFRRDADVAATVYGHVGIYLYERCALERFVSLPQGVLERTEKLEQLRALENGMRIAAMVLPAAPPKGIDTPEDYEAFVANFSAAGGAGMGTGFSRKET